MSGDRARRLSHIDELRAMMLSGVTRAELQELALQAVDIAYLQVAAIERARDIARRWHHNAVKIHDDSTVADYVRDKRTIEEWEK